jgi:hypothetical protein
MYNVKINEPNKFFTIKGKQIRSPFLVSVQDNEIKRIQSTIKFYGILDYEILHIENNNQNNTIIYKQPNIEKVKKEELKPVVEIINLTEVQAVSINNNPRFERPKKIDNNIKNKTSIEEIKIEELTYKTSSILENLFKTYEL